MFGGLGMGELVVIFMVVLLLFGAKRLPEIGSSLGKGIREFKGSLRELEGELKVPPDTRRPELPRRDHSASTPVVTAQAQAQDGDGEGPRKLGD
jgi:sec-independent protein translocase protein TatA